MIRCPTHPGVRPRTLLVLAVLVLVSCETAYYAAMEKLGYPKRDLLVSRVQQARDSQQVAKEQFQSALERFRHLRDDLTRLCARYLLHAKLGKAPLDPVARFHLANGARLQAREV